MFGEDLRNPGTQSQFSPPPLLRGYMYRAKEAYEARDSNRLLAIRLETNKSCNLRCRYCYAGSGADSLEVADFDVLKRIISEAKALGIKSVVVIGGGEPTLYPKFRELVAYIDSLGIIPVVFSNTVLMTGELAEYLYRHNASVMGKLDSLKPEVQDFIAGREGAFRDIRRGLGNLMNAGFSKPAESGELRLGISFVSNKLNLEETGDIWHFCRQNNIFPNMEILTPTGRANDELEDKLLTSAEIKEYKLKLLEIDRNYYGYDWLPYTPITACGCLQHLYSLYINIEGNVRPCAPTKLDEHPALEIEGKYPYNINKMSLKEIYTSSLFKYVRNIDSVLEGRCGNCENRSECIGCRGYAYSIGINNGADPLKALRMECQQCFKLKPGQVQEKEENDNVEKLEITSGAQIEKKLCESLRQHELPDYLLYTGTYGAKSWLKLDESETFPVARQLTVLLEKNIASIIDFIPTGMSLVSVGVGSGDKEKILLDELVKKNLAEKPVSGRVSIRYYPIDINRQFVDLALEKVNSLPIEMKGIVGFIEDLPLFKKHWRLPVLFCILGNTFCNYDPEFILKLIYENLEQGDLFLLDADLLPGRCSGEESKSVRKSVLGIYDSKENALFNMYPLLQYGMDPEDFDFELLLGHVGSRIGEVYRTRKSLNILKDAEIQIGQETVTFKEGDIIRMGFTYKYTYEQTTAFLKICGFDVLSSFLNEDRSSAIILAKKHF